MACPWFTISGLLLENLKERSEEHRLEGLLPRRLTQQGRHVGAGCWREGSDPLHGDLSTGLLGHPHNVVQVPPE